MIYERDVRDQEAAQILDRLVAEGYSETAVRAFLPALLGPEQAQEDAIRWLANNAGTGYGDMSPESLHAEAVLGKRARTYVNSMLEEDALGDEPYNPGTQFAPSDDTVLRMLDDRAPNPSPFNGRENTARVLVSEAEAEMGRRQEFYMHDAGTPDWA